MTFSTTFISRAASQGSSQKYSKGFLSLLRHLNQQDVLLFS